MRKEDLSKAIGDIDPKLVESSLAYRPAMSKHRLTKIVALAACLAIIVTAIPLALILNRESGNTEDLPTITDKDNTVIDKPEPDKEEPLVIFCSSPNELKKQLKADAKVEIKDVAERKDFSFAVNDTVVEKKDGTPYVKTITIGNETFEISYNESRASETYQSLSTHLKAYASVDKYSTRQKVGVYSGKLMFEFSHETGKLINYYKEMGHYQKGNLGEKELHKIALQEIYNLYGIDIAKDPNYRYECHHILPQDPYQPQHERYQIIYRRYINGYSLDEVVSVTLDTSGQIVRISQNLGLYDEVAEMITEENVNMAIDNFNKQFDYISTFDEFYIRLDNYGLCYVSFKVTIPFPDGTAYKTAIKIELSK